MIIDFHCHTFPTKISKRIVEQLGEGGHINYFTDASSEALAESMKKSGIDYAVNLPVMTRIDQVVNVNNSLIARKEELEKDGIITFGGLHPDFEDYTAEIKKLKENGIKGVKFHPAYQGKHINDISFKRIISAVSDAGLITLLHTGWDIGYPDEDYAPVSELLELIEDVKPAKTVFAHLGGWQNWDKVRKYLAGAPVWFDTACSLGEIAFRPGGEKYVSFKRDLSQDEFVLTARALGVDRVLFASDSPWADQGEYIDFVNSTSLAEDEKKKIFGENAAKLLNL